MLLKHLASRPLETKFGRCEERLYYDGVRNYIALVVGEVQDQEKVLCRVHSSCMSAHYFNSIECDCREQMEAAQQRIHQAGRGVIVWLDQEARDNGHLALMVSADFKAHGALQTQAYERLGLPGDARTYHGAAMVLKELGVSSILLLTNNPAKVTALRSFGIQVEGAEPLVPDIVPNPYIERLYEDKRRQKHTISPRIGPPYDFAVLGDINVDVVVREGLPFNFGDLLENGVVTWRPIDDQPGGTGLNFAESAVKRGASVFLVGKVGADSAGTFLKRWLQSKGIANGVSVGRAAPTGRAIIVRDNKDVRLLVDNAPNANQDLSEEEVRSCGIALDQAKFAYVSGYAIRQRDAESHAAAVAFMQLAAAGGATLIFDVVPHRIYETYSFKEFRELTKDVGILISEVATMRRFLGVGRREESITRALAEETVHTLRESKAFKAFVLRYGPSGCDEQIIWDGKQLTHETLGHAQAGNSDSKRGFGDRASIDTLIKYFGLQL